MGRRPAAASETGSNRDQLFAAPDRARAWILGQLPRLAGHLGSAVGVALLAVLPRPQSAPPTGQGTAAPVGTAVNGFLDSV